MPKTTLDCPAGPVICDANEMAICIVENGKQTSACIPILATLRADPLGRDNWTLEQITRRKRAPHQKITDEERDILRAGEYSPRPGVVVRFKVPLIDYV
jgi:hypothetical protein